jgi:glycosyltransferase involved in cell wall biosynthesis
MRELTKTPTSNTVLKVLALTRYERTGASSRIRFIQFLPELERMGIFVELSPLLSSEYLNRLYSSGHRSFYVVVMAYLRRIVALWKVQKFDLLWIEKELFPDLPPFFEKLLNALGIKYIVDYDDATFHSYDQSNNPWRRFLSNKIDGIMRGAKLVVCGNEYLATRARLAGAERVEIIPSVIDLERYSVRSPRNDGHMKIGWIGSPGSVAFINRILPQLADTISQSGVVLKMIGASPMAGSHGSIICVPWSEVTEVEELHDIDIGIMPLQDTPWERGKCGYKLIQYMACGIPIIASAVGVNKEIVNNEKNGLLVDCDRQWPDKLQQLIRDESQRLRLGMNGRQLVEERYCTQVVVGRLHDLFRAAVSV